MDVATDIIPRAMRRPMRPKVPSRASDHMTSSRCQPFWRSRSRLASDSLGHGSIRATGDRTNRSERENRSPFSPRYRHSSGCTRSADVCCRRPPLPRDCERKFIRVQCCRPSWYISALTFVARYLTLDADGNPYTVTHLETKKGLTRRAIDQLGFVKDINSLVVLSRA
jgi:hypothetical protein